MANAALDNPDQLYPWAELPARPWMPLRAGRPVPVKTVENWIYLGLGGRKLRTAKVGGLVCTCDRWAREFFDRDNPTPGVKPPSPAERERRQDRVNRELAAAGI